MAKDISSNLVGLEISPINVSWGPDQTQFYALAVGADPFDDADLQYVYEGKGPKVLPLYPVVKVTDVMDGALAKVNVDRAMVLHGEQAIKIHRPLPATFNGTGKGTISQVWDKGKAAVLGVNSVFGDANGPLVEMDISIFIRGAGGFGGERGPSSKETAVAVPDRDPDVIEEYTVAQNQAALYRMCGDRMLQHIDPEFAKLGGSPKPFLHGLCTYSIAGRHIIKGLCSGDETRLVSMTGRFAKQVWMGDQIITKMWTQGSGQAVVVVENQDGDVVLNQCKVEFKPE